MSTPSRVSLFNNTYDWIIVGGGTAGPVVARRLAEGSPCSSVLLIEAGPPNDDITDSLVPLGWQNLQYSKYDWDYDSVPQKNANNRVIHLPRGKFLGGCSGSNATLMIRGPKADYDRWAAEGNKGWGWNDVRKYFNKSETFHPNEDVPASDVYHGTSGPLHTTVHPLAPISEKVLESWVASGEVEYKPDMFVEGEYEGIGHATRTVYNGIRTSGADFIFPDRPRNLTVLTNAFARRVILSDETTSACPNKIRAVAVEVEDSLNDDTVYVIQAMKEIVLSAGSYNSPCILMHSGIGPKEHLKEVGLKCSVDMPDVGNNLMDHLLIFTFYKLNDPGLTYDREIFPEGRLDAALKEWAEKKTGVVSRFPYGPFVFKRMNAIMQSHPEWIAAQEQTGLSDPTGALAGQPHIEFFNTELYLSGHQFTDYPTSPTDSVFAALTMLTCPVSRGTVRLSDSDPHSKPVIDHAYFDAPLDLAVLAEGCRLAHKVVVEGEGTKKYVEGAWPTTKTLPGVDDVDGWKEYVKANVGTTYHPSGTCKMGRRENHGVVDDRLRVHGVDGLRIADVSIMPWINNGHTQAPAYMIGEKCAAMILEDH